MNWLIWYETLFLYFRFKIFNICNVVLKLWENVCFLWVRGYLVGVVGGGVLHNLGENLNFPLIVMQPRWWPQGPWWHPDTWSQVRCQVTIYTMCIFVCGHNIYLSSPLVTDTLINGWSHENINTGYQYNIFMIWFMVLKYGSCDCFCQWINVFTRASIYLNVE